jgi:hypothetical protein
MLSPFACGLGLLAERFGALHIAAPALALYVPLAPGASLLVVDAAGSAAGLLPWRAQRCSRWAASGGC